MSGHLKLQDLKHHLVEIPGAIPKFAEALGVNVPGLFEKIAGGEVSTADAARGYRSVLSGNSLALALKVPIL